MRQAGLGVLMSVKGDAKPVALVEDTAVPPERLADFVTRSTRSCKPMARPPLTTGTPRSGACTSAR